MQTLKDVLFSFFMAALWIVTIIGGLAASGAVMIGGVWVSKVVMDVLGWVAGWVFAPHWFWTLIAVAPGIVRLFLCAVAVGIAPFVAAAFVAVTMIFIAGVCALAMACITQTVNGEAAQRVAKVLGWHRW